MNGQILFKVCLLTAILFILSCQNQDESELKVNVLNSPTSYDLYCIDQTSDGTLYIGGGDVWLVGVLLTGSVDDLKSDSFTTKAIYDLSIANDGRINLVGNDSHLHFKEEKWKSKKVSDQIVLRTFDKNNDRFVFGGGKTFQHGFIRVFSKDLDLLVDHQFSQQINSIVYVEGKHWFATGYGAVYESYDDGDTWSYRDDVGGDSFSDIHFLEDKKQGFISGHEGSLFETIDGGETWHEEIKGSVSLGRSYHFNKIVSYENSIWLIGDRGILFYKKDKEKWRKFNIEAKIDLYNGMSNQKDKLLVVGEGGFIAEIEF